MFSNILTAAICGMDASIVHAEVDVSHGLPGFLMVGYLGSEVREATERVRVALKNTGITLPPMRITVNLSPADIRKSGTSFDLPVAVGILQALGHVEEKETEKVMFAGELSLDGEVNEIRGVLPIVRMAGERGIKRCIVPWENEKEGAWIPNMEVIGVSSLKEVIELLKGKDREEGNGGKRKGDRAGTKGGQKDGNAKERGRTETDAGKGGKRERKKQENYSEYIRRAAARQPGKGEGGLDFAQVRGQAGAKRAAEIAAAGFHNLLLIGPPGAGKTMIAKRISGILPLLTKEECLEVSSIYSISGLLNRRNSFISTRPFLNPHHTITAQALSGGGAYPRPGVISLAHKGILFLDEMPEFGSTALDMLRQPLEEKTIQIVRLGGSYEYPADFMLVGAMNPCPCGYYPDMERCRCTQTAIRKYQNRLSGPVLDRIDICAEVPPLTMEELEEGGRERQEGQETSADIRSRVLQAREMQRRRGSGKCNAALTLEETREFCRLDKDGKELLEKAFGKMKLSARAYSRILKVARTIADLDGSETALKKHLAEAISCRVASGGYWER